MAQINNSFLTSDCIPPTSPIQKILIVHLNLHALCENGNLLGENASLEEISEEILLYHRGSSLGISVGEDDEWNLTPTISNNSCLEEAVNFLGLCKALYTLPASLNTINRSGRNGHDNDDSGIDKTNSIYFGNSILVFVQLESTLDVLAIVQVSRLYQNGIKSDAGSGNPLAISASIERTHRLFCILRGGGIVHRLDETSRPRKSANGSPCYLGMKKLFGLLKEIREKKDILSRQSGSSTVNQSTKELYQRITELEEEVESCRESLPIQSLRRDIDYHYKEYLNYFLEVFIRNGGAGRCLVEMMPVPIAQDSGSHIFQLPPSKIEQRCLESLEESLLRILQSYSSCSPNEEGLDSSLLGIATFESGRLLHYFSNFERTNLSNDTVTLLMSYMASYRIKMRYAAMPIPRTALVASSSLPKPQLGLLKRLAFHLGPMVDKTPNQTAIPRQWEDTDESNNLTHNRRGRFLPSPPPFMLSVSDHLFNLSYENSKIWAPRVHFPLTPGIKCNINKDGIIDDCLDTHMIVFEFLEFSFLIFMKLASLDDPGLSELSETTLLLMYLEEKLSEAIIHAFKEEACTCACSESMPSTFTNEFGQDVILVEQSKGRMVLLLNPKLKNSPRDESKRMAFSNKNKSQMRHFASFGPMENECVSQSQPLNHRSTTVEWSALGLDCRHLLASRLPLDICLAFDDMINEVRNVRRTTISSFSKGESNDDEFTSSILELCTCMPYGWIFALATEDKEIYVFFDNSIYVTIADVQFAVLRLKERYFVTK